MNKTEQPIVNAIKFPFSDFKKLTAGMLLMLIPPIIMIALMLIFIGNINDTQGLTALGGLFSNLPLLITLGVVYFIIACVIRFIITGYGLFAAKNVMNNKYTLPRWNKFWEFLKKGFGAGVIGLVYSIPALIVFGIFMVGVFVTAIRSFMLQDPLGMASSIMGSLGLLILGIILVLLACYVSVSATLNYIHQNKFSAAFTKTVFKKAFTGKYFVTGLILILYTIGAIIVASIVSMILGFIPIVGPLLLAQIVSAYLSMIILITFYSGIGRIYPKL